MKSCEEMVNSLLERKAVYEAEQKRKKRTAVRISASLCCVCIIAVLGIGVNRSGLLGSKPPVVKENDLINTEIITEIASESYDTNGNIINVQPITGGLPASKLDINLRLEDFISMSHEEMIEYYGVDYIPDVPEDIKPWKNEVNGIYRRNGGTGEVYWDIDILNYSSNDFTRNVHLEIAKNHIPFCDYLHFKDTEKMSVINGAEVFIGLSSSGYYYTQFMYKGAGFIIDANGLTENEFVAIIASIIN